ncbi:MAG: T9SS type A sorting domain-containing protein [Bacteroidetes bacterium]|nr:T9SS type A sorting domain-containing protein [Bacteroidota bacterium]
MKSKSFFLWAMIFVIIEMGGIHPVFSYSNKLEADSIIRAGVKLNGTTLTDSLYMRITSGGNQVEARKFMQMLGGGFCPFSHVFHQNGFMTQYGRYISFTGLGFDQGMVNLQLINMVPPAINRFIAGDSVYFTPLAFLAQTLGGTITYDAIAARLEITAPPPPDFGVVFPPAAPVAHALRDLGYVVQQGEINKENPIEFCLAGYTSNANGNNADFPYFGIQLPPHLGSDSIFSPPINFTFQENEAMVYIGLTPPECKYYSFRSYLMNRYYEFPSPVRIKINASLGETTSLYRMRPDLPLNAMFGRKFALIMSADSLVAMQIMQTILAATPDIAEADIHFDIIPAEIFHLGLQPQSDWGNFLCRAVLFADSAAQQAYMNNVPVEIMRVTPVPSAPQLPFSLHPFLPRACGTTEFALLPDIALLEEAIYNTYHANYEMIMLLSTPLDMEGFTAIQLGQDANGDNHDALYIFTSDFQFRDKDRILAYGVNHNLTGKAEYTNVDIYGRKYMNGFGGISNTMLEKSARQFIADTVIADQLFAWTFTRHPIPGNPCTYIVPSDTNNTLEGINVNDTAFFMFRLYVNTATKIGPDPLEVTMDRTVLLRPFSSGIPENRNDNQYPVMKVFPNPVTDKTTLEFFVPEWSDVNLSVYNSFGQEVGSMIRINHVRGTVLQVLTLCGNLPSGIYFIRGMVCEKETGQSYPMTTRIVVPGGK